MKTQPNTTRGRLTKAAIAGLGVAMLAACSSSGESTSAGGPSVDADATQEEYIEAFAEVEPIVLTAQTTGSPGITLNRAIEEYVVALDEWSGGKITVDLTYGNAIAEPAEVPAALSDGRIDFGTVTPTYDVSRFQAFNLLDQVGFLGLHTPVLGTLQVNAGLLEAGFDTPEIYEEAERQGFTYLMPYGMTDAYGLGCIDARTDLSELSGAQVRAGSTLQASQLSALNASPVSVSYPEVYESLQRGVIDCQLSALWLADLGGSVSLSPEWTFSDEVGFSRPAYALGFSLNTWESLPLVAQQLMHDRLDVFIENRIQALWEGNASALAEVENSGGAISEFAADAETALAEFNSGLLDETRESSVAGAAEFVDRAEESTDGWLTLLTDDLGYTDEVGYDEFGPWFTENGVDLTEYMQRVVTDILNENRPS